MLALVVASLSTGHKIGLATVGAAFIVFALVSSFVLPRRIPNFPGRFMGLYLTVAVLYLVMTLPLTWLVRCLEVRLIPTSQKEAA